MRPDTICFLDFDHTLFDTDRFFHVDVRKNFLELGLDIGIWERTYDKVCLSGYTLEKHAQTIHDESGQRLPLRKMHEIIHEKFSNLEQYLFPDVVPFLKSVDRGRVDLAILSFGNPEWQKFKIEASGIAGYFQYLFFTEKGNSKKDAVLRQAAGYRCIVVVDNHPRELDAIKDLIQDVETFLINRVPERNALSALPEKSFLEAQRYVGMIHRHNHAKCTTLCEVKL